jgi:hypothetical protein
MKHSGRKFGLQAHLQLQSAYGLLSLQMGLDLPNFENHGRTLMVRNFFKSKPAKLIDADRQKYLTSDNQFLCGAYDVFD